MAVILLSRALLSNLVHIYYGNQSELNMAIFTGCFVIGEAPLHISWVSQMSYKDCHPFQQTGNRVLLIALRNLYNRVGILTQLFYCHICVLAITSDLSNCLPPSSCSSTQKTEQLCANAGSTAICFQFNLGFFTFQNDIINDLSSMILSAASHWCPNAHVILLFVILSLYN